MLESPVSPARSQRQFPDLIPKQIKSPKREYVAEKQQPQQPEQSPIHIRPPSSGGGSLPRSGSPSRQALLEAVKGTLERRKNQPLVDEERKKDVPQQEQSRRVGFYQFHHETASGQDKLSRLSVQKLPSVTIATRTADRPLNHVINVQSPSIETSHHRAVEDELLPAKPNDPTTSVDEDIQPDDVARLVSDILATQLELAVDSLGPIQRLLEQPASPGRFQVTKEGKKNIKHKRREICCCQRTFALIRVMNNRSG